MATQKEEEEFDRLLSLSAHMSSFAGSTMSDVANAERFMFLFRDRVKYCPHLETWYVWDGKRWAVDKMNRVELMAQRIAGAVNDEATVQDDPDVRKMLRAWAKQTSMHGRIKALLQCAAVREELTVSPDDFDANPWVLNVRNGTIELHEKNEEGHYVPKFREHKREDLITCMAPVDYDPDAIAPEFLDFAAYALRLDEDEGELFAWTLMFLGYCLTGDVSLQCWGLFCGQSETGKSTMIRILHGLLGHEYAGVVKTQSLYDPDDRESQIDFANVAHCRFVTVNEGQEGRRLPENFIKSLTGGEKISIRDMYEKPRMIYPKFKLAFGTNFAPAISEGGESTWRRMIYHPFTRKVTKKDSELPTRIVRNELPGVLNWLLKGLCDLLNRGNGFSLPPKLVYDVVKDYREEEDSTTTFLDTYFEVFGSEHLRTDSTVTPESMTPFQDIYTLYRIDTKEAGEKFVITAKTFAKRLSDVGIMKGRSTHDRTKVRMGIKLSAAGEEKLRESKEKGGRKMF